MPINNYTTGRDVALLIQMPTGPLQINITDFEANQTTNEIKSKPLSGPPIFGIIPDGWTGSFKVDRQGPAIDNYFAQFEAGYYNGQNQPSGTIFQTVNEPNGGVSQYQFIGVVLKPGKLGDYSADKRVEQTVSFMASQRTQVT